MAPRSNEENQRIRDERRQQILFAAARVFARRGLAATKIADIAAEVGMSHGLVYHYFPSKEDLFAELVRWAAGGVRAVTEGEGEPTGPWERIRLMLTMMLGGVRHQPDVFLVMTQAAMGYGVPDSAREIALQYSEESHRAIARVIAEGQTAGVMKPGAPDQMATTLLSAISGLAVFRAVYGDAVPGFPDTEVLLAFLKP
jgi:AcrR family transcriptional regulator